MLHDDRVDVAALHGLLDHFFELFFLRQFLLLSLVAEIWNQGAGCGARLKQLLIKFALDDDLFHEWPLSTLFLQLGEFVLGVMDFVLMPIIKLIHKHVNLIQIILLELVELDQQLLVQLLPFWEGHLE